MAAEPFWMRTRSLEKGGVPVACDRGLSVRTEPQERSSTWREVFSFINVEKRTDKHTYEQGKSTSGSMSIKTGSTVAVAQGRPETGKCGSMGTMSNDLHAIEKLLTRLRKAARRKSVHRGLLTSRPLWIRGFRVGCVSLECPCM